MRACVIGAGFAGLAAALDVARAGHHVAVLDGMDRAGGLASGFRDEGWDWDLERFYHHLFATDDKILGLASETGFADKVITRRPVTAFYHDGHAHALDGPLPVLRFPGIPFVDRVRMGLAIAYLKVTRDWRPLEHVAAADWVTRRMGRPAYDVIWQPLLEGKFGSHHTRVPMSWLWARLHKRSMRLIYFEGGFQAFADHLRRAASDVGAEVRLRTAVEGLRPTPDGRIEVRAGGRVEVFDRVIATTAPHVLARMAPDLPPAYLAGLEQLQHLGAVVAVLALDRRFMRDVYWLSMDKRAFPFLAVVEHTNFMERDHYGGDVIVYVGDYLPPSHRYFSMDDADVLREWYAALPGINREFDPAWVRRSWLFRSTYAQPVVPMGFSRHIPPLETPIPGLYLASMSQVYPWDRGTNYAVEIGREAARAALRA